jgi:hypothetical protein
MPYKFVCDDGVAAHYSSFALSADGQGLTDEIERVRPLIRAINPRRILFLADKPLNPEPGPGLPEPRSLLVLYRQHRLVDADCSLYSSDINYSKKRIHEKKKWTSDQHNHENLHLDNFELAESNASLFKYDLIIGRAVVCDCRFPGREGQGPCGIPTLDTGKLKVFAIAIAGLLNDNNLYAAAYLHGYDSGRQFPYQLRIWQAVGQELRDSSVDIEIVQRRSSPFPRQAVNVIRISKK